MGKNSKIEWTDHTWNPWIGCSKVSAGCEACYAEALMDKRYGRVEWGVNGTRVKTKENYWRQPAKWNREAQETGIRRKVFCGSLCDVFEDRKEFFPWRRDLYKLIKDTPHLDWLLLTKRPGQIRRLGLEFAAGWPDNVWLGTSVEDQAAADKRIPELLENKASLYFLSLEPLLGPVDLDPFFWANQGVGYRKTPSPSWVIAGGESAQGQEARPYDVEWYLDIADQCWLAHVKVFHKQLGSNPVYQGRPIEDDMMALKGKNDNPEAWPEEWQLRESPEEVSHETMAETES